MIFYGTQQLYDSRRMISLSIIVPCPGVASYWLAHSDKWQLNVAEMDAPIMGANKAGHGLILGKILHWIISWCLNDHTILPTLITLNNRCTIWRISIGITNSKHILSITVVFPLFIMAITPPPPPPQSIIIKFLCSRYVPHIWIYIALGVISWVRYPGVKYLL